MSTSAFGVFGICPNGYGNSNLRTNELLLDARTWPDVDAPVAKEACSYTGLIGIVDGWAGYSLDVRDVEAVGSGHVFEVFRQALASVGAEQAVFKREHEVWLRLGEVVWVDVV